MRYCEPEVGRFVNQDPIGLNGSINFYTFSFNITKWIDPFGWSCDEDNVKKVKELARNLSPKFKQRFKCEEFADALQKEFADALQKEMEKEGIQWRKSKS